MSKANPRASKWDAENMTVVSCRIRTSDRDAFRQYAEEHGTTIHALLKAYVESCIQNKSAEE